MTVCLNPDAPRLQDFRQHLTTDHRWDFSVHYERLNSDGAGIGFLVCGILSMKQQPAYQDSFAEEFDHQIFGASTLQARLRTNSPTLYGF
jgi:translation elongation factor EF-4